jgi:hypothetical protein
MMISMPVGKHVESMAGVMQQMSKGMRVSQPTDAEGGNWAGYLEWRRERRCLVAAQAAGLMSAQA